MAFLTQCPACSRDLNVPDLLAGREVKCPTCGLMFEANGTAEGTTPPQSDLSTAGAGDPVPPPDQTASRPSEEPPPPPPPNADEFGPYTPEEPPPLPVSALRQKLRTCPYCSAENLPDAPRCCYCDEPFDDWGRPRRRRLRRDAEPHRGSLIMTLGLISVITTAIPFLFAIGLPCSITAWFMGQRDLRKIRAKQMDPAGESNTQAGWICGIIGTLIHTLYTIGCVGCFGLSMMPWMLMGSAPAPAPSYYQQSPAPTGGSPYGNDPPYDSKPEERLQPVPEPPPE